MATKEERLLAWRVFKSQCTSAGGKAFQDLFWAVMKAKHGTAFETVGPQGAKGDGGNDGFFPADKHYFQLYSPIDPKDKAGVAARKIVADFTKILAQWDKNLSSYTFVYNDKYTGTPKEISLKLNELRKKHKAITFASYGSSDLENDFLNLPEIDWERILGGAIPDPDRIAHLDYGVFGDVVRQIVSTEIVESDSRLDLPPELDEKIMLNRLSKRNSVLIQNGALQTGHVEKYFKDNSAFALGELRDHVVGVYEAAKKAVVETPSSANRDTVNEVFAVFRRSLFPKSATTATTTAVDAVIGYFFESCDVFDPKRNAKGLPGASP